MSIPMRATIGRRAVIMCANGLGCRYIVQSGRRTQPPASIPAHLAKGIAASQPRQPPDSARKAAWLWGARELITDDARAAIRALGFGPEVAQVWLHANDFGKSFGDKTREWEMEAVIKLSKVESDKTTIICLSY